MIIYLDESGDLGFDFSLNNTSRYLIMTCLICRTAQAIHSINRAVKLTLKNKLPVKTNEIKGGNTSISIKNYFFRHAINNQDWGIMSIAADKQAWLNYHAKNPLDVDKNLFYDDVAKRLLAQVDLLNGASHIQIIVDKSKTKSALVEFDRCISSTVHHSISNKTLLSIHHRQSFADPGLQATDMFGWGIYRKYQKSDMEWYELFKHRISLEMEFKF